jgi:hypothetical protein
MLGQALPFGVVIGAAVTLVGVLSMFSSQTSIPPSHAYQSVWVLIWVVYGGVTMLLLADAAINHLPWRGTVGQRRPLWLYAVPTALFIVCTAPYLGLRTEASIAMFSNLHTEAGVSNHLLIPEPLALFPYQSEVAMIKASSDPDLQHFADRNQGLVMFSLKERLRRKPEQWVTYELNGVRYDSVTRRPHSRGLLGAQAAHLQARGFCAPEDVHALASRLDCHSPFEPGDEGKRAS